MKILRIAAGTLLVIAGLILCVIPGPGIPVLVLGFGLLSHDLKWAAALRERVVTFVRHAGAFAKRHWRVTPVPLRVAFIVFVGFVASAAGYGAWRVVF